MMRLLVMVCLLFKASASEINAHGSTTAAYGGEAQYTCEMDNSEGVQQVTWQRSTESIENLATYSARFGQQVNEPYRSKVSFTKASLSSSSITLRNVTWEDESCYICSFNGFPDGSTRKQTCLRVRGISEVNTMHDISTAGDKHNEVVFSCSATGKPAPTIQWVPGNGTSVVEETQTTTETNGDGTFTSRRNVTLQIPAHWDGHVECLLNRGMMGERLERISYSNQRTDAGSGARLSSSVAAPVVIVLIFIFIIVAVVILRQKRLKRNRRNTDVTQEEGFAFQQAS